MVATNARGVLVLLVLTLALRGCSSNRKVFARERRDTPLEEVEAYLDWYTQQAQIVYYESSEASWTYNTNVTAYNAQKSVEASVKASEFTAAVAANASKFTGDFPADIQRQLDMITNIGSAALGDEDKIKEFSETRAEMISIYSTSTVCRPDNPEECHNLDPGLSQIMADSNDYDDLVWAWQGWRDVVGRANKDLYIRYVELSNEAARANGFADKGAQWRANYEMGDDIIGVAYDIYETILPLYKELHAYVRRRLSLIYGDKIDVEGRIPACVLGDMWGRFWGNVYNDIVPYPDQPSIDVTNALIQQAYTPLSMFHLADDFFVSIGLEEAPPEFWNKSMIERPDDREVVCHATAWDFSNQKDFRIKMCTDVNMDDLLTIHHEMGHIQYYLQYKHLPFPFRDGANIAFHEAVGEVMTLSVATPKHLHEIHLLDIDPNQINPEVDINFLLKMALTTIGTLPFSIALEQWRWDVFAGDVDIENWTERWWSIKRRIVGVEPPVERTEDDFDPGAMYHIVGDYSFMRYYFRTIIQFQFQKAMCDAAGHTGPLHQCDIYRSAEAGAKLGNMLKLGSSLPWPDAMEQITGQRSMSADAIMSYFEPLYNWLQAENQRMEESLGWPDEYIPDSSTVQPTTSKAPQTLNTVMYATTVVVTAIFSLFIL